MIKRVLQFPKSEVKVWLPRDLKVPHFAGLFNIRKAIIEDYMEAQTIHNFKWRLLVAGCGQPFEARYSHPTARFFKVVSSPQQITRKIRT